MKKPGARCFETARAFLPAIPFTIPSQTDWRAAFSASVSNYPSGHATSYTGVGDPYFPFRKILGLLTGDVESMLAAGAISTEQARHLWRGLRATNRKRVKTSPIWLMPITGSSLSKRSLLEINTLRRQYG
jgi:hypothetical protein